MAINNIFDTERLSYVKLLLAQSLSTPWCIKWQRWNIWLVKNKDYWENLRSSLFFWTWRSKISLRCQWILKLQFHNLVINMIPIRWKCYRTVDYCYFVGRSPCMFSGRQCRHRHSSCCPCMEPGHMVPLSVGGCSAAARLIKPLQHREHLHFSSSYYMSVAESTG